MNIQIVSDSTSDIPDDLIKALPITIIPVYITLNGKNYQDRVELSREEFYQALPSADPHPMTAAPSPEQFIQVYDRLTDEGAEAIISIHISSSLSAIYQSALAAAVRYTRIPVIAVDSGNLSLAMGLLVIKAAEAVMKGKTVDEVMEIIRAAIPKAHAFAKLDTIEFLLRGGRLSSIQHSVISLLGIKPILKMNNHISKMEIARTKGKAFEKVVKTALTHFPKAELFGITHAAVPEQVEALKQRLAEVFPGMTVPWVSEVTPALGAHVGPGALCINWIEKM